MEFSEVEVGMFLYDPIRRGMIVKVIERVPEHKKIIGQYLDEILGTSTISRDADELKRMVDVRETPAAMRRTIIKCFEIYN
jgi:hypothetical protein